MNIGQLLIYMLFALDVLVFGAYLMSAGEGRSGLRRAGRVGSWVMLAVSGAAVLYLGHLFLADQFSYEYVHGYSSAGQPVIYKISAIWAGQEGTFLLWMFFLAIVGVILTYTLGKYESWGILYEKAMEMVLCAMLLQKSPFLLVEAGVDATVGQGMNPLLMNPWMAIHPPVMFLGYALAVAPFVIFLAGVTMKEPREWMRAARGWTIMAWAVLGVGIFLGMYWSYEVLGWGGYWAWDPVENASLFSWIVLCAAAHGMILQAYRPGYALWNGVLVSLGYVMVVFSTFLTRSGVLADVSLHSFQGLELYFPLMMAQLFTAALALGMVIRQALLLKGAGEKQVAGLKPLILTWSIYLFMIFFAFVFVGTDYPLFDKLMGRNPSPIQPHYYNVTSFIPAIPVAVLLFLVPMIFTRKKEEKFPVAPTAAGAVVGLGAGAACAALGIKNAAGIVLAVAAAAAVVSNCIYFVTHAAAGKKSFASYLSHVGIAVMLAGFIFSALGTQEQRLAMSPGETKNIGKVGVTVEKMEPFEKGERVFLKVKKGRAARAVELDYIAKQNQRMKINRPHIVRSVSGDIYIAPIEIVAGDTGGGGNVFVLEKTKESDLGNGTILTFEKFDLAKMNDGIVGIVIIAKNGEKEENFTIDYGVTAQGEITGSHQIEGTDTIVTVTGIDASNGLARVETKSASAGNEAAARNPELTAIFQVSNKPFIGSVWLGMILLSVGSCLAAWRRFRAVKTD